MILPASNQEFTTKSFDLGDMFELINEFNGCLPTSLTSYTDEAMTNPTTTSAVVGFESNPALLTSKPKVILKYRGVPPEFIFRHNLETSMHKILF